MDEVRLFAQKVAVSIVLDGADEVLRHANVTAVMLKGAWLLTEVYDAEALRPTTDVDLLVSESEFEVTLNAFKEAGFSAYVADWKEVVLDHPALPLPIDLHRAVFPRHTFALRNAEVFARSRPSAWHKLRFPHPLDGMASIVGHFAISRDLAENLARDEDLQRIAEHFGMSPASCAAHFTRVRVARAARYVAATLVDEANTPQTFCQALLQALPPDPLGQGIVELCRFALPRISTQQKLGALLCCLLEQDLPNAFVSAASRGRDVVANRIARRRR